MAALAGACPAAVGRARVMRPLRMAAVLEKRGMLAGIKHANGGLFRLSAAQSTARPRRSFATATPGAASVLCRECNTLGRRWYSSSDKPPKDDPLATIILGPPPSESSISTPPPPLPKAETQSTSTKPEDPIQAEEIKTTKTETTDEPAESTVKTEKTEKPDDDTTGASSSASSFSSLPSFVEARRSALNARFSRFMDDLQARFVSASQTLSDLTGYTAIEHIKEKNAQLERDLVTAQDTLRVARRTYQAVNERRAATQREVTTLLARKDSWAPPDLERFTVLYRQDHELETSAQRAVEELKEAEAEEARLSAAVTSGILKRYHEEQVWSDRIRRQSTWGTWGLMGLNIILFIVLQLFAEPWRRRRLMRGIAEAESGVLEDVRKELADVRAALATVSSSGAAATAATDAVETNEVAAAPIEAPVTPAPVEADVTMELPAEQPVLAPAIDSLPYPPLRLQLFTLSWPTSWKDVVAFGPDPARWKAWAQDITSERTVNVRMRDVSIVALQSAAAGAVFVGGLVLAFR